METSNTCIRSYNECYTIWIQKEILQRHVYIMIYISSFSMIYIAYRYCSITFLIQRKVKLTNLN